MNRLLRLLVKGASAALPALLTIYLLWWFGVTLEAMLGAFARALLPDDWYVPGMGLALGVLLMLGIGMMLDVWLVQRVARAFNAWIGRVPLIKSVYGALRDMMRFFRGEGASELGHPVLLTVDRDKQLVGFLTSREPSTRLPGVPPGTVTIYVPLSYQIGGFYLLVREADLQPLDLSVTEAMRIVLTAGIGGEREARLPPIEGGPAPAPPVDAAT